MKPETYNAEKIFSVELKSRGNLKNVNFTNGNRESVLIEGTLGKLEHASFEEDLILEIVGQEGVLRINLQQNELKIKRANEEEKKQ
jgi:hypothetical protein